MRKARSESKLKALAEQNEDFGEKVFQWALEPKTEKCIGGQAHARQQLAADGISVSSSTFSDFFNWWRIRRGFMQIDSKRRNFEELLAKQFPTADPKSLQEFGQAYFTFEATAANDREGFVEMEQLRLAKSTAETKARQKDADLKLAGRRVSVLERREEKLKKILGNDKLSIEEREARMKQTFGM